MTRQQGRLHEGNVLRALLKGSYLGQEHLDQALTMVENLETEIIKLNKQAAQLSRGPLRGKGIHTKLRQHLVDNLFIILEYPEELRKTIERRLAGPVSNPFEVVDSAISAYWAKVMAQPAPPVLVDVEDPITESITVLREPTGPIRVVQLQLEGLES